MDLSTVVMDCQNEKTLEEGSIILSTGGVERIRFTQEGRFIVEGRPVTTDIELYQGFRRFLADAGYLQPKDEKCPIQSYSVGDHRVYYIDVSPDKQQAFMKRLKAHFKPSGAICACCGVARSIYEVDGHNRECVWYEEEKSSEKSS